MGNPGLEDKSPQDCVLTDWIFSLAQFLGQEGRNNQWLKGRTVGRNTRLDFYSLSPGLFTSSVGCLGFWGVDRCRGCTDCVFSCLGYSPDGCEKLVLQTIFRCNFIFLFHCYHAYFFAPSFIHTPIHTPTHSSMLCEVLGNNDFNA